MIAKVSRGWRVGGLIHYLMGPGRFNEHTNPHVIAAWDGLPEQHQPPLRDDGTFAVEELAAKLADPALAAGLAQSAPEPGPDGRIPQGMVWHCSLRNGADDPVLSDEQWAEVVEDLVHRTGIAIAEDPADCRWVAIRHADDHVHVAALLVRQDNGRRVHPHRDFVAARQVCREAEVRYGLTATGAPDRTAGPGLTRAEMEKAERLDADTETTPRERLQAGVRAAAARARDTDEFLRLLGDRGVLTRVRRGPDGVPTGYAVAEVGDLTAKKLPVWFSGGKLAPDLTLGKLRQRWEQVPPATEPLPREAGERSRIGRAERSAAVAEALAAMDHASATLATGDADPATGDAIAHATGDMVEAVSEVVIRTQSGRQVFSDYIGEPYARAARTPHHVVPRTRDPHATALRGAARRLAVLPRLRTGSGSATALVLALAQLVAEVAATAQAHGRLVQAEAATRSSTALATSAEQMAATERPPIKLPRPPAPAPAPPAAGHRRTPRPQPAPPPPRAQPRQHRGPRR